MEEVEDEDVPWEMKMICLCSRKREEDDLPSKFSLTNRLGNGVVFSCVDGNEEEGKMEKKKEKGRFVIFGGWA
ncbi:hypothetical protein AAC387_Pa01g1581 [Persea americana]